MDYATRKQIMEPARAGRGRPSIDLVAVAIAVVMGLTLAALLLWPTAAFAGDGSITIPGVPGMILMAVISIGSGVVTHLVNSSLGRAHSTQESRTEALAAAQAATAQRVTAMETNAAVGGAKLDGRLERIEGKIDNLTARTDQVEQAQAGASSRLLLLEQQGDAQVRKLTEIEGDIKQILKALGHA